MSVRYPGNPFTFRAIPFNLPMLYRMPPLRGLIIRSPWIELIVSGRKVWELRPANCRLRGSIALIRADRDKPRIFTSPSPPPP
jgi:hypothetical protein